MTDPNTATKRGTPPAIDGSAPDPRVAWAKLCDIMVACSTLKDAVRDFEDDPNVAPLLFGDGASREALARLKSDADLILFQRIVSSVCEA